MTTHSRILAWRIPWTEEPSGLESMESQRVRQDWATTLTSLLREDIWLWVYTLSFLEENRKQCKDKI